MIFDTNLIIRQVRNKEMLPPRAILPVVVVGEVRAFALKANWGYQKVNHMESLLQQYPVVEITATLTELYAAVDAFSQGKLKSQPLPPSMSSRNMGKNDLWIATTALYFDQELHTTDQDFDHLTDYGLRLVKYS